MLDIAEELSGWTRLGRDFAVATVVSVSGSAPRQPGAALAVDTDGTAIGSVSGGCVEAAVYEACQRALEDGAPALERFGYSDDDAFAVGLACGGTVELLITPVRFGGPEAEVLARALTAVAARGALALARVTDGPAELMARPLVVAADGSITGSLGGHPLLDATAAAEAKALLDAGRTGTVTIGEEGSYCGRPVTLLVEASVPPPRLLVFGANDFASALTRAAKFLGFHVTLCDARSVFATPRRFPDADEVVVEWPHRYLAATETDSRTVVCVLTHDAKFDVPLLQLALRLPLAYVGAMGSRRTHEDRNRRLREAGVTEGELARLHSPIGLDLGARSPEETALSIVAEIVAERRGGSGLRLTGAHTPIHHEGVRAQGTEPVEGALPAPAGTPALAAAQ